MKSFIQFLKEGVIDEPPNFYEGKHPHEIDNDYLSRYNSLKIMNPNEFKNLYGSEPDSPGFRTFNSNHEYHDPKTGVRTNINMTHANPLSKQLEYPTGQNSGVGIGTISIDVNHRYGDVSHKSDTFKMPGDIIKDINVGREHVHDFIQKMTPLGLNTITYSTPDPKRHALYQKIAKQYPHLKFENMENTIPTKRLPKIGLGAKLGIAGAALGLATGADAADLVHGLNPLSVLDGGSLGTNDDPDKDATTGEPINSNQYNFLPPKPIEAAEPKPLSKPIPKNYSY